MQSNDWLATLMSGLGGAFTGVGVARDRRATDAQREAEMQMRQRQATMTDAIQGASLEGQMGQLGYRREMPAPRAMAGGAGVMGAAGAAATNAMEGMRRGPTRETPIGTFQLDRLATPDARAQQDRQAQSNSARAELERRAAEKAEEREFTAGQNALTRASQERAAGARNAASAGRVAQTPPRAPTDAQEKSALFFGLMQQGVADMESVGFVQNPVTGERTPNPRVRPLALQSALTIPGANYALNDDEQKFLKAARDFAAGVLRKESGAALRDEEVRQTMQRYIDFPGDAPAIRAAKAASRRQYMGLMERSALPALRYYDFVRQGGAARDGTPDPDFGGLPNNPEDYN